MPDIPYDPNDLVAGKDYAKLLQGMNVVQLERLRDFVASVIEEAEKDKAYLVIKKVRMQDKLQQIDRELKRHAN